MSFQDFKHSEGCDLPLTGLGKPDGPAKKIEAVGNGLTQHGKFRLGIEYACGDCCKKVLNCAHLIAVDASVMLVPPKKQHLIVKTLSGGKVIDTEYATALVIPVPKICAIEALPDLKDDLCPDGLKPDGIIDGRKKKHDRCKDFDDHYDEKYDSHHDEHDGHKDKHDGYYDKHDSHNYRHDGYKGKYYHDKENHDGCGCNVHKKKRDFMPSIYYTVKK